MLSAASITTFELDYNVLDITIISVECKSFFLIHGHILTVFEKENKENGITRLTCSRQAFNDIIRSHYIP